MQPTYDEVVDREVPAPGDPFTIKDIVGYIGEQLALYHEKQAAEAREWSVWPADDSVDPWAGKPE
jgi:hypothetical protein